MIEYILIAPDEEETFGPFPTYEAAGKAAVDLRANEDIKQFLCIEITVTPDAGMESEFRGWLP